MAPKAKANKKRRDQSPATKQTGSSDRERSRSPRREEEDAEPVPEAGLTYTVTLAVASTVHMGYGTGLSFATHDGAYAIVGSVTCKDRHTAIAEVVAAARQHILKNAVEKSRKVAPEVSLDRCHFLSFSFHVDDVTICS
jgi:hypothetical protein